MAHGFLEDQLAWIEDLAINAWLSVNPSPQWASRQVEPYLGLPFGTYLHSTRPRRQRALTGPLDPSQDTLWHRMQVLSLLEPEQQSNDQVQSGLLSKLPYDVRIMIYEMVLGGNVFHLFAQNARSHINYYVCSRPDKIEEEGSNHTCSDGMAGSRSSGLQGSSQTALQLLSPLLACRKMYSEAIPVLYSANIFVFTQNFAAFTFLKLMLPSQRLFHFRHFRLHMRIPRHPDLNHRAARDWRDLWIFFRSEMSGLRHLYVELQMLQPTEAHIKATSDIEAEAWMKPLVIMAVETHRKKGCVVEIETRRIRHRPAEIYLAVSRENVRATEIELLSLTCAALHRNVRLSLE